MTIQMVTSTIQLILAPVVMVSACAILLTGLLGRYAAVNDQLRAMARERLDLVVLVFIGCMFVIALAAATNSGWAATAALVVFLAGTAVLLIGVQFAALEVRTSDRAIHYEIERIRNLGQ